MNTEPSIQRLLTKVIIDVACLLTVGIPIYIFYLSGTPYKRGFYCDDESLRHPYLDSTVPSWVLYVVGLGLPILVILIIEYLTYAWILDPKVKYKFLSMRIPSWTWESYRHIGVFGFGAACSQLITDVAKYTVGRLRPHFFDVCNPKIDCSDPKYRFVYIENFTCRQQNEKLLKDMRLSFPSGHSSFSAYCMLFLVVSVFLSGLNSPYERSKMYLQARMTWRGSKLLKHVLQYICIMMAFYTALTRISDYKHHWSDVLAGSLQGIIVAVLIVLYVSDLQQKTKQTTGGESAISDGIRMENDLTMR